MSNTRNRRLRRVPELARRRDVLIGGSLFIGFLLLRLPFLSNSPVNWDAVSFVLATRDFDIQQHQPHPPGFIGFVVLGRLLNHLTGDPNLSLSILSAISGALAPAAFYFLARIWMARRYALATAIMFGTTPLVWYYSGVALSYSIEVAIAIPFVWASYRAMRRGSTRDLLIASVLIALLGAMRQTGMALLILLWIYILWFFPWRARIQAAALAGGLTLLWLAPLIWLAGGPIQYIEEVLALARSTGGPTSIFTAYLGGLARNLVFVAAGILVGINVGLLVIALARRHGADPLARLSPRDRIFFLIWVVPALATFLLGHTGQLGYILLILPLLFIWIGLALAALDRLRSKPATSTLARAGLRLPRSATGRLATTVALFALINSLTFLLLPSTVSVVARSLEDGSDSIVARHVRQYDVAASDQHWQQLVQLVGRYDADSTAVLTTIGGPRISGSYRHLAYYLPDYRVYGLGRDQDGTFGYFFFAHDGIDTYNVHQLETARRLLPLPPGVHRVIIPDLEIAEMLADDIPRYTLRLADGSHVVVARVEDGATLTFVTEEDDVGEDGEEIERVVMGPPLTESADEPPPDTLPEHTLRP